jgi:structural maintenance of chromosome 4
LAEESKAALRANGGAQSKALEGILKAARKGGELSNAGILGRLGDLASIPENYDVAVSTACSMLDHIVIQTTAGAQKCLQYLRTHGLGRANFIPLDKMSKGAHDRAVETPEGAKRLFELITPSNFAITPAIYLGVKDTLVAPDLETATRWAYDFKKRWRVVTLDGGLIETSGTMAGGGKSVRKGGVRFTSGRKAVISDDGSALDCENLEKQTVEALEQLQQCRKQRKELSEEIRMLRKRVKELSSKLPKLAMDIKACDTSRETLTKRIPELRSQCELSEADNRRLKTLKSNVEKCKSDMAACAMLAAKLEGEVGKLQKLILDAGGPRLKKQVSICDQVVERLNNTEKALNTAKVAITSSQKAATKAREALVLAKTELEKCNETKEAKLEEIKTLEVEALSVMQAFEKVKQSEASKRKELESVTKEVENLKKSH